jgi:hypothetical protein
MKNDDSTTKERNQILPPFVTFVPFVVSSLRPMNNRTQP